MTEMYNLTVDFFVNGGIFIWPIAIVFAIGLAICNERWRFLAKEREINGKAFQDFLPLLRTPDVEKMHNYSRDKDAAVVRIIGCGLDMMKVSNQRADIEHAMSEGMLEIMPKIEDRASYLSMLANVATLLGLLGTIIGLIGAFTAVANADPSEKAQLLSESISVAMNTTAFGLIAAIPLLILNALLQKRIERIVSSLEMSAVKFLNIMTVHGLIEASQIKTVKIVGQPVGEAEAESAAEAAERKSAPELGRKAPVTATEHQQVAPSTPAQAPVQPAVQQQPMHAAGSQAVGNSVTTGAVNAGGATVHASHATSHQAVHQTSHQPAHQAAHQAVHQPAHHVAQPAQHPTHQAAPAGAVNAMTQAAPQAAPMAPASSLAHEQGQFQQEQRPHEPQQQVQLPPSHISAQALVQQHLPPQPQQQLQSDNPVQGAGVTGGPINGTT